MRLSQLSIQRPVLATVMSLIIVLFGAIAAQRLPNRELPDVDPPVVSVTTVFPGAAPEVVETSVTQPLEDLLVGIEGVKHITSTSREQVSQISVEFTLDREVEAAANDVRDRVARARGNLPDEIDDPVVAKQDSDAWPFMWAALSSERYDQVELTRIAEIYIKDRIGKLPGVSTVLIAGERRFAMRVWIDNDRLTAHNLTIADVSRALTEQNVDIPSGRIESADREYTVRSLGELKTAEAYRRLVVASRAGHEPVRLGDVARVEAGPEDERKIVRFNGSPGLGLGVVKQSKANTLEVADVVRAELARVQTVLPPGVETEVAFDSSRFIRQSIDSVRRTIYEAAVLVVLVIFCFLRSVRATLIPAVAIPVSVVGAFGALYVLGFTINTLTLMGITLAIGLVVDDAIVVVENITRWMEAGHSPVEAARRGMAEISFAVVSATLSAVAVFLPLTFLSDTTGRLFREFAVTVAAAVAVSGFVALTLSPALCALVVRKGGSESRLKAALARVFDAPARAYARIVDPALSRPGLWIAVGVAWVACGAWLLDGMPQELIPVSDRGVALARMVAPEGSTIEYTDRYQRQAEAIFLDTPEVERVFSVVSLGLGTPGLVNEAFVFSMLVPEAERERHQREVVAELNDRLGDVAGVKAFAFEPRPLGSALAAPVSMVIQGQDVQALARLADQVKQRLESTPGFRRVDTNLYLNKPQLEVHIDRDRASDLGVSVRDVAEALQILLGGMDLSTFNLEGETYDVIVQLRRESREQARQLMELYVHGHDGHLIPLLSVVDARETIAPRALPHFDRFRAVTIDGRLEDGFSQSEALAAASVVAENVVPRGEGYQMAWTGDAEKFFESGNALLFAYVLAVLVVYLVLSAQFESFVHPLTILVAVALSFTGALLALEAVSAWREHVLGQQNPMTLNLYSKIGLVMLVGLVTKNSILIVEFANQLRERGRALREAVLEAARIRFRPILMTALATIAGLVPIAAGLGAGGESRQPLGVAVVGGVFFATFLSFFIVPAVYLQVEGLRERWRGRAHREARRREVPAPGVAGGR